MIFMGNAEPLSFWDRLSPAAGRRLVLGAVLLFWAGVYALVRTLL